jgi:hypothetical protein
MYKKTLNLPTENSMAIHEIIDYIGDMIDVRYQFDCDYDEYYLEISHSLIAAK